MPASPSKYAENQFLTGTIERYDLMIALLEDAWPKVSAAAVGEPLFQPAVDGISAVISAWTPLETTIANLRANIGSLTASFEDKMASLQRKPDLETNSPLETWDSTIRAQVPYNGSVYLFLLPEGRVTLTEGTYEQRLDALRDFSTRLSQQVSKPVLTALGATVSVFHSLARGFSTTRETRRDSLETALTELEALRVQGAEHLYGMVGTSMSVWKGNTALVDSLYDLALLRRPQQGIPAAPLDTTWTPAQRRLATTALPAEATRLQAWRLGPGGAPELLATGDRGALEVTVPADITFDAGKLYDLWLVALNGRGSSGPGPVQTWTAP